MQFININETKHLKAYTHFKNNKCTKVKQLLRKWEVRRGKYSGTYIHYCSLT